MALPPPPPSAAPVADPTTPDDARGGWAAPRRWVVIGSIAAVVGGAAGFVWASGQPEEHTATARISFVDRVDIGAVDAERARILAILGDDLDTVVEAEAPGAGVTTDAPSGRNFIDLVVASEAPTGLENGALAGAAAIVDAEAASLADTLLADAAAERDAATALDTDVAELEAEMAEWLEAEAAAEILRSDEDAGVREQAFIDARNANDSYWKAVRIRNSVVDQQNEFIRNAERLEAEANGAASMTVSSSSAATRTPSTSPALGAAGGALAGIAAVLVAAAALAPRRR